MEYLEGGPDTSGHPRQRNRGLAGKAANVVMMQVEQGHRLSSRKFDTNAEYPGRCA
jgi:hypothetical protein